MDSMTLYRILRKEIEEALVNRNRDDIANLVHDLTDDNIHEGERLMVDEIERQLDEAIDRAKERSTCSGCLARTYRQEECVCGEAGPEDAEDYDESLQEELSE